MKPKFIRASIRRTSIKKFVPLIIEAQRSGGTASFLMQIDAFGNAQGILLPPDETKRIAAVLKPIIDRAEKTGEPWQL